MDQPTYEDICFFTKRYFRLSLKLGTQAGYNIYYHEGTLKCHPIHVGRAELDTKINLEFDGLKLITSNWSCMIVYYTSVLEHKRSKILKHRLLLLFLFLVLTQREISNTCTSFSSI